MLLLLPLLFSSCTPAPQQNAALSKGGLASHSSVTRTPTPQEPVPGPVPANCPISAISPTSISPNIAAVTGVSPVWATWPEEKTTVHLWQGTQHTTYLSSYGWSARKTIWEVGPDYMQPVELKGYDIFDNTPLYFQFLDDTPVAHVILDPHHPDHPRSVVGENWVEWGSEFVIPKSGCYKIDVTWATGHWSVTFAVGA